jgi:hypothetical protein
MKNRLIGKGILAIVLVFGFFVVGCPTDTNNPEENNMTKFEGTWKHQMAELNAVYVFTGSNWSFTSSAPERYDDIPTGPLSGTFTFDETSITFTAISGGAGSWTQPYTLKTINNKEGVNLDSSTSGNILTRLTKLFINITFLWSIARRETYTAGVFHLL